MRWFILLLGIASNASASVLVKLAMTPPRRFPSLTEPLNALTNWPLWSGLALYGLAFLLYAAALTRLPLNVAHPILTSGAIAMVALSSVWIFREPFYWNTFVGILLIVAGVVVLTARVS
jgi:multidrug transporter EmrE-like cation transporter